MTFAEYNQYISDHFDTIDWMIKSIIANCNLTEYSTDRTRFAYNCIFYGVVAMLHEANAAGTPIDLENPDLFKREELRHGQTQAN